MQLALQCLSYFHEEMRSLCYLRRQLEKTLPETKDGLSLQSCCHKRLVYCEVRLEGIGSLREEEQQLLQEFLDDILGWTLTNHVDLFAAGGVAVADVAGQGSVDTLKQMHWMKQRTMPKKMQSDQ